MNFVIIIFCIVSAILSLATLVYVIADIIIEKKKKKEEEKQI